MRHKIIFIFAILLATALPAAGAGAQGAGRVARSAGPFPAPDPGYITDLSNIIVPAQRQQLERWIAQAEQKSGVQFRVLIIDSIKDYPGTPNQNIEAFAAALFDRWGIGNLPGNDGVLLLVALKDRKARIELGAGYGRARDVDAVRIMDNVIVPKFRNNNYPAGVEAGVRALVLEFAGVRIGWNWPLTWLFAATLVAAVIAISLFQHGKRGWGWVFVGLSAVLLLGVLVVVFVMIRGIFRTRFWDSGYGDYGGGSFGGGGFGGGGFGGGGFSGGGGATGSW